MKKARLLGVGESEDNRTQTEVESYILNYSEEGKTPGIEASDLDF